MTEKNEKLAREFVEKRLGCDDIHGLERPLTALLDRVAQEEAETGDAQRCCFEPVSDYLSDQLKAGVPCYEDVIPAIKALVVKRDAEWERIIWEYRIHHQTMLKGLPTHDEKLKWPQRLEWRSKIEACDEILKALRGEK